MSALIEEEITTVPVNTDDGDHDRFKHFYKKKDLDRAFLEGQPITALCGKVDVPTRDFTKYPLCKECEYLYENVVQPG